MWHKGNCPLIGQEEISTAWGETSCYGNTEQSHPPLAHTFYPHLSLIEYWVIHDIIFCSTGDGCSLNPYCDIAAYDVIKALEQSRFIMISQKIALKINEDSF